MPRVVLRILLVLLVTTFAFSPAALYARGPGGRGGGARGAGGPGGSGRALAKPTGKKKSTHNAGGQNGIGKFGLNHKLGGSQKLSGGLQKLNGNRGGIAASSDKFQRGAFDHDKLQTLNQQPRQEGLDRGGQHRTTAQNALDEFQNGPQPFTAAWYAEHPNAWQAAHPHADAWAAATASGVAAWLGWAAYNDTPAYGSTYSTTYVYEQPADESGDSSYDNSSDDSDDSHSGTDDNATDWLALGTYSVQSDSGEPTSRYFQLSTNRQGELRGVYYDEISGSSQNLSGTIDESTRVATWSIDANQATTFRADLGDLTQATGTVVVTQKSGKHEWRIAREQNPT